MAAWTVFSRSINRLACFPGFLIRVYRCQQTSRDELSKVLQRMAIVHPSNDKIRSSGDDSRRSFIYNTLFLSISELTASHVDHVHVHQAVPDTYGQPIGLVSQPKSLIDQIFELVTKNKDDGLAHDIKRCFFFTAKAY